METAPPPSTRPRKARRATPAPRWPRWLLLGLLFGLGYGLTQRFLEVPWGESSTRPPAFNPKSTPGQSATEATGERKGDDSKPSAANLKDLAEKRQEKKDKEEAQSLEERERKQAELEEEKTPVEQNSRTLEDMGSAPPPPTLEPPTFSPPQPPRPEAIPQESPAAAETPLPGETPAPSP